MPDYDAIIKAVENDKPLPKNVIDIPDVKESHTSYINRMQELNERIAQLTELVNTGTKTLESLEETLKTVEKERDRLADQRAGSEPKFERADRDSVYFSITSASITSALYDKGKMQVECHCENNKYKDDAYYRNNNYFHTDKRAQEIADKINFLLKLERLHDAYCPEYEPNYNNEHEPKWTIYFSYHSGSYKTTDWYTTKNANTVCFPTKEIAEKVCDVLNTERKDG